MDRRSKYPMLSMDEAFLRLQQACDSFLEVRRQRRMSVMQAAAAGVTAAEDVRASRPVPASACSRLDGYAVVAAAGVTDRRVVGRHRPGGGHIVDAVLSADEAVWVTTGGALPLGADAVVPVEDTAAVDGADVTPGEETRVRILASVHPNNGVRAAGSDLAVGTVIVAAGSTIGLGEATTLLSAGIATVSVFAKPTVAVLSTGDELVDPLVAAQAPAEATGASNTFAMDTNRPMLFHVLRSVGYSEPVAVATVSPSSIPAADAGGVHSCVDCGICPDTRASLLAALQNTAAVADVVITSGGVSMGDRDYVKPILESWPAPGRDTDVAGAAGGSTIHFGRLNMKPGKPATCATVRLRGAMPEEPTRQALVFALPGNPVSAWVCAQMLVLPALRYLASGGLRSWSACLPPRIPVRVLDGVSPDPDRPEYVRAMVWAAPAPLPAPLVRASAGAAAAGSDGLAAQLYARVVAGSQASSRIASISQSNALLWIPAASELLSGAAATRAGTVTYESSDGEKRVAFTPPFTAEAFLIGPLLHAEALPGDLADVSHLRELKLPVPAAAALAGASSHASSSGAGGAGSHRHGCRCGMNHELQFSSVREHLQAAGAPATAAAAASAAGVATGPAGAPVAPPAAAVVSPPKPSAAPPAGHALQPAAQLQVRACILTVSDRCAAGTAVDKSGPAAAEYLSIAFPPPVAPGAAAPLAAPQPHPKMAVTVVGSAISPDDPASVARCMRDWLSGPDYPHLVLTTGGTGLGPRDVTPEALRPFITRPCHGLQHAMLAASLGHTPMAALSRYEAGIIDHAQCAALGGSAKPFAPVGAEAGLVSSPGAAAGVPGEQLRRTLLVEMPGSVKAVVECMDVLAKVLPHALSLVME